MATAAPTASAAPAGGQDAIAGALGDRAVVGADDLGQEAVVRLPDALRGLLTERGALGGRVDAVREEDRRGAGEACDRLAGWASLAVYFALRGRSAATLGGNGYK